MATILPFSDRQAFGAVEAAMDAALLAEANRAVFTPAPIDQLGIVVKPTFNPASGVWELARFRRFVDAKGAMADRRVNPTGEQ